MVTGQSDIHYPLVTSSIGWLYDMIIWLVVDLPLWKIWVRQLGWLFPIYGKIKNIPNHQPVISSYEIRTVQSWGYHWYQGISPFRQPASRWCSPWAHGSKLKTLRMFDATSCFRRVENDAWFSWETSNFCWVKASVWFLQKHSECRVCLWANHHFPKPEREGLKGWNVGDKTPIPTYPNHHFMVGEVNVPRPKKTVSCHIHSYLSHHQRMVGFTPRNCGIAWNSHQRKQLPSGELT